MLHPIHQVHFLNCFALIDGVGQPSIQGELQTDSLTGVVFTLGPDEHPFPYDLFGGPVLPRVALACVHQRIHSNDRKETGTILGSGTTTSSVIVTRTPKGAL